MTTLIKRIKQYENVHEYVFVKEKQIHRKICSLLSDMNFSINQIENVDIPFEELNDEVIYVSENNCDIYIFVNVETVHILLKTDMPQEELHVLILKHFNG